jgi:signal peptidase II
MNKTLAVALLVLVAGLIGCDHATKHLARSELRHDAPVSLVGGVLHLTYVENRDFAFSALRSVPYGVKRALAISTASLALPLLVVFWYTRRKAPWPEQVALALLLAGDAGNLLDRIFRGYVVDFIHLRYWPVFNVADICITAGVLLFLWKGAWPRVRPSPTPG